MRCHCGFTLPESIGPYPRHCPYCSQKLDGSGLRKQVREAVANVVEGETPQQMWSTFTERLAPLGLRPQESYSKWYEMPVGESVVSLVSTQSGELVTPQIRLRWTPAPGSGVVAYTDVL